jgi:hypothetical protein
MLFDEYQEDVQIYRQLMPASGFADPTWSLIDTITGRIEPIGAIEIFNHNQSQGNITEIMMSPIDYKNSVLPDDMTIDADGVTRKVIGWPEIWKWEMPHIAVKLQRVQWAVTIS